MNWSRTRVVALLAIVTAVSLSQPGSAANAASWLDASKLMGWNKAGRSVPAAPRVQGAVDPRCRALARPPELEEDRRLRSRGWDLVGAYHGGWHVVVILGTATYDGMCRPWHYQSFVFVRGIFAGTLSPEPMDSRMDGALSEVALQSDRRLTVQYLRYSAQDPLCCPSRTTSVVFDISPKGPTVEPTSASTSPNR
jgi:hypothetical protein